MIAISRFFITLLLILMLSMSACRGNDVDSKLIAAENALANSDFSMARKICDEIVGTDSIEPVCTTQLCRLSMILMELSEQSDQNVNVSLAALCYHKAMSQQPDSATAFYDSLPLDRERLVHMLRALAMTFESDSVYVFEDCDSVEFLMDSLECNHGIDHL